MNLIKPAKWRITLLFLILINFGGLISLRSSHASFNIVANTADTVNYLDVRTYQSPNKNFTPVRLQTHKGLLRFGVQNTYILLPDGGYRDQKIWYTDGTEDKRNLVQEGKQAFLELLNMHYLTDIYKNINKTMLTAYSSAMYEEDKNSYTAQQHLLKVANAVTHVDLIYRYFCNAEQEDCTYNPAQGYFRVNNFRSWGGKGANQFQQLKAYRNFVNDHLSSLQSWSGSLLENDTETGYYVFKIAPGPYDFKNQGFWLNFSQATNQGFFLRLMDMKPQNAYERKLASHKMQSVLLPMAPDKAEKFVKEVNRVYLVMKVKVTLTGMDMRTLNVTKGFTVESPAINLYKDEALSQQFGTLQIDQLIIKEY